MISQKSWYHNRRGLAQNTLLFCVESPGQLLRVRGAVLEQWRGVLLTSRVHLKSHPGRLHIIDQIGLSRLIRIHCKCSQEGWPCCTLQLTVPGSESRTDPGNLCKDGLGYLSTPARASPWDRVFKSILPIWKPPGLFHSVLI